MRLLFLILVLNCTLLAQNSVPFNPVPNWVKTNQYDYSVSLQKSEISNGSFYLFYDEQYNLNNHSCYFHYAYKIASKEGLQNNSELVFNYNPAFEKFNFNFISVLRDGKKIDYRNAVKINVARREQDLENYLIDASLSVIVIFNGLRAGDIIEYAYVKSGINPIFKNKEFLKLYFNGETTQLRTNYRVIFDTSQHYNVKYFNKLFSPTKTTINKKNKEIEWDYKNVEKVIIEDNCPAAQLPYSSVEISQYQSWEEIENWAFDLFNQKQKLSSDFLQKLNDIKNNNNTSEQKIIESIRFVQDEIRYFGIEIGVNSHIPQAPSVTYERRYGDCKDKSILLCAFLDHLEVKVNPVLINSNSYDYTERHLAAPHHFDHVIVCFEYNNKRYFVDPTISNQRGDLSHFYCPNYGKGIVVDKQNFGFDTIPISQYSGIYIDESYEISSLSDTSVLLTTQTKYLGDEADNIRSYFTNNSMDNIRKDFLDYYNTYYSNIRLIDSISYNDDQTNNVFVVSEKYNIADIWKSSEKDKRVKATVNSQNIAKFLKPYGTLKKSRQTDMTLSFPIHYKQSTTIKLKKPWKIDYASDKANTDYLSYSFTQVSNENDVVLTWELKTFKDRVAKEKYNEFKSAYSTIENSTAYEISDSLFSSDLDNDSESDINWRMVTYYSIAIVFMVVMLRRRYLSNK